MNNNAGTGWGRSVQQIAVFFPGQGVLNTAVFQHYQAHCPEMMNMFAEVDEVATEFWNTPLRYALSAKGHPGAGLDLVIFLMSVVGYLRLHRQGLRPQALIGHGFGEISALVAADALALRDGAEMVARRFLALRSTCTRYKMAALNLSRTQANSFLRLVNDDRLSIAAENSTRETVIVGPAIAIAAAADLARLLGISCQRLRTARGPHRPSILGAAQEWLRDVEHLPRRAPRTPVYSPLLRRFYRPDDDALRCVAEQLAEPVAFADAVHQLAVDGVTLFIECGPLRGLASKLDYPAVTDLEVDRLLPEISAPPSVETDASSEREVA